MRPIIAASIRRFCVAEMPHPRPGVIFYQKELFFLNTYGISTRILKERGERP